MLRAAGAFAACAALAAAPAAAAEPKVEVTVRVEREVVKEDASGRRVVERQPVRAASAGDVLVYTLDARNVGDAPAATARLEDPIPKGTVLVLDSVGSEDGPVLASLDGGASWTPFPATVEKKTEDGRVERVPAPAEAYTHLRWSLPGSLEPGANHDVSFKVRIR